MTANELAKLLEVDSWYKLVTREEVATMLRQQQAEIEALKKEAALQRLSDFTQEAEIEALKEKVKQNAALEEKVDLCKEKLEPVAWMQVYYKDNKPTKFSKVQTWEDDVPLYTHPAKTLTDEEIKSEAKYFCHSYHSENPERLVLFARAILRKAQEK